MLFSQFIRVCFIICRNEKVLFNRLMISWPPWVRVCGWASHCQSLFFLLACPFVSRAISFIYDRTTQGGGLDV